MGPYVHVLTQQWSKIKMQKKMKYEGEGVQKSNILMKATHKKLNTRELFQKMHEKSPILRIRRSVARTSSLPLSHLCLLRWSL